MKPLRNTTKLKELSVFFPCYNEEANLRGLMTQVIETIPRFAEKFEIIFVNDGSTDNTSKIAHAFAKKYPFVRVIDQENQGYGGAVNSGLKAARYSWVFFTDADLQFNLKDMRNFVAHTEDGKDMIIGYRIRRAEGLKRIVFARGMKVWNFFWLGFPWFVKDVDCAFKLIRKPVIDAVGELNSKGNLVSTEFLLKANRLGFSIHQIGVNHYNRKAGVSNCGSLKDVIKVIKETFVLLTVIKRPFNLGSHLPTWNRAI